MNLWPPLWPHQISAVDRLYGAMLAGNRRCLFVLPTGGGKTVVAAHIMRDAMSRGLSCLFLAHRRELVTQAAQKLLAIGIDPSFYLDGGFWPGEDRVAVASIQTLMSDYVVLPEHDLVIVDEAHIQTASKLLRQLSARHVIGLTATPKRNSGVSLGSEYDVMVLGSRPSELLAAGIIVPPRIRAPDIVDLRGVGVGTDYDPDELAKRMLEPKVIGDIVTHWKAYAKNQSTLVFCCNRAHAEATSKAFRDAGVFADVVLGNTPKVERDRMIAKLRSGELRVLCGVSVLAEGFDMPDLRVVVIARPTKSLMLYLQMCGRGGRSAPGKTFYELYDHVGAVLEHGLPTRDHEWELSAPARLPLPAETMYRCTSCFCVIDTRGKCPYCGNTPVSDQRAITVVDGKMVEVDEAYLLDMVRAKREQQIVRYRAQQYVIGRRVGLKMGKDALRDWVNRRVAKYAGDQSLLDVPRM